MAKGYTLDTRPVLYGEPRLSDAQFRALRRFRPRLIPGALAGVTSATLTSLDRAGLIDLMTGLITERGRKTLAAIEASWAETGHG